MRSFEANEETTRWLNDAFGRISKRIKLPVAIRLIKRVLMEIYPDRTDDELYDLILFRANPSLSFPRSDIDSILFVIGDNDNVSVDMRLNFMSIIGSSSPLPIHYSEQVLDSVNGDHVLIDFLDILNHRLKRLIYPIWEDHRYYVQYQKDLSDHFSKYILSLIGLRKITIENMEFFYPHKLLPYAGMLMLPTRPIRMIEPVLQHYFGHNDITVEEGIKSKAYFPLDQQSKVGGQNSHLGINMTIGEFSIVRDLKFRIHFDNVSWAFLEEFSPLGKKPTELSLLMRYMLKQPLMYQVTVTINPEEIEPAQLGGGVMLGINSWPGTPEAKQTIVLLDSL